jgi:hypothetical protein
MKTLVLNPKKFIIILFTLVIGIFGLSLLIITLVFPINDIRVYVEAPTNAPPWVLAAAATNATWMSAATNKWITQIPFDDAINRFVSKTDIAQIKQVIPWNKTILHLYLPKEILVESPTRASAEFSRQHLSLKVYLIKEGESWHVDHVSSSKWELLGPPNLQQRIAELLPR